MCGDKVGEQVFEALVSKCEFLENKRVCFNLVLYHVGCFDFRNSSFIFGFYMKNYVEVKDENLFWKGGSMKPKIEKEWKLVKT